MSKPFKDLPRLLLREMAELRGENLELRRCLVEVVSRSYNDADHALLANLDSLLEKARDDALIRVEDLNQQVAGWLVSDPDDSATPEKPHTEDGSERPPQ